MIAARQDACPSPTELEAALVGSPEAAVVVRHVEGCAECRRALEDMRENLAFLEHLQAATAPEAAVAVLDAVSEGPPGYRLDHIIRRGGQGVVYHATHLASGRAVAVKILLDGRLASERTRRRFEREVEIVAGLDAADIVTLHDSGIMPDGCPYLVMEYLDGHSLDHWLDAAPRDLDETLALFTRLAEAVDAAHRHGVIHRDLKPANIIVDDTDRPCVIDFGIAAVRDDRPTPGAPADPTRRLTMTGEFMGTLAYVAPEQVRGDWRAVDTSTDVYALGMMLYEAVAGHPPREITDDLDTLVRSILDDEPTPPTSTDPRRPVSRDLQTIILTCLALDPHRRYANAGALAADLRRLAAGEPIDARRDDRWYLARKVLARHRAATITVIAFIVLLASSTVVVGNLYRQSTIEATRLRQVNLFLEDTIGSVAASHEGDTPTVHALLQDAEHWVDLALGDDPAAASSILVTLANGYRALGDRPAALRLLDDANMRCVDGDLDEQRARIHGAMALVARDDGRLDDAAQEFGAALALRRAVLGPDHPMVAMTLAQLGRLAMDGDDLISARTYLEASFRLRQRSFGADHPEVAMAHAHLGDLALATGDLAAASRHHERALAIRRATLHPDHPDIARSAAALELIED